MGMSRLDTSRYSKESSKSILLIPGPENKNIQFVVSKVALIGKACRHTRLSLNKTIFLKIMYRKEERTKE